MKFNDASFSLIRSDYGSAIGNNSFFEDNTEGCYLFSTENDGILTSYNCCFIGSNTTCGNVQIYESISTYIQTHLRLKYELCAYQNKITNLCYSFAKFNVFMLFIINIS